MVDVVEKMPLQVWIAANTSRRGKLDAISLDRWVVANAKPATIGTATARTTISAETYTVAPSTPVALGPIGAMSLVFREEFDAPLNPDVWNTNWLGARGAITKGVNGAEDTCYDPACVSVANSHLALTCKLQPTTISGVTYNYRSGLIESAKVDGVKAGKEFTNGIFEARISMPGTGQVMNNWGAFWLNGHHYDWPDRGENDIMENLENGPAWHYHSPVASVGGRPLALDWSGWHTYTCEWTVGRVRYWYDGVYVGERTNGVLNHPNYIVLNYAVPVVNPNYGGPIMSDQTMLVDYVRVWQR